MPAIPVVSKRTKYFITTESDDRTPEPFVTSCDLGHTRSPVRLKNIVIVCRVGNQASIM
jgi:hypothetical protein